MAGEIAELGYSLPDDVSDGVDRAESLVFDVAQRRVTDTMTPLHDLLGPEPRPPRAALRPGRRPSPALPTGYIDLDEQLSGLQPSNLVVVGARPAMGKTAFALGMAAHAGDRGSTSRCCSSRSR